MQAESARSRQSGPRRSCDQHQRATTACLKPTVVRARVPPSDSAVTGAHRSNVAHSRARCVPHRVGDGRPLPTTGGETGLCGRHMPSLQGLEGTKFPAGGVGVRGRGTPPCPRVPLPPLSGHGAAHRRLQGGPTRTAGSGEVQDRALEHARPRRVSGLPHGWGRGPAGARVDRLYLIRVVPGPRARVFALCHPGVP